MTIDPGSSRAAMVGTSVLASMEGLRRMRVRGWEVDVVGGHRAISRTTFNGQRSELGEEAMEMVVDGWYQLVYYQHARPRRSR